MPAPLRSILAATDLGGGSDAIVASAATLAARTGAELHLLHSLELPWEPSREVARRTGFFEQIEAAEARLRDQADRAVPEGVRPASRKVIIYVAHKAILDRAREVSADLIVVGRHRGGAVGAHFLGTTADRVIRTAEVPCLVVEEPLAGTIRSIGVPVDCSDPSQGALETALAWGLRMGGDTAEGSNLPGVRVMHVGWTVERHDDPELEARTVRPELERLVGRAVSRVPGAEALDVGVEVVWADDPTEATVRWAAGSGVDLLVMGTHGSTGLKRALIGSVASGVARRASCPVLLVPPALWSGHAHAPRLERVAVATDFGEPSVAAAGWSVRHLAPQAEHLLVHVLEVPEPPPLLAGRFGSREELLRTARDGARGRLDGVRAALAEGGARMRTELREGSPAEEVARLAAEADVDLVVLGEHGPRGPGRGGWTAPGGTAERMVRAASVPVLVVRGAPDGPPRHLLAALDGSEAARRALRWADFLRVRSGGSITALYVESPIIYGYAGMVPPSTDPASARESGWVREREPWLREEVRRAGIDPDTVSVRVAVGRPADEILAVREHVGADAIVMGSHGRGALGRVLLGSVAGAVLRAAPCPVLVTGDPGRRAA